MRVNEVMTKKVISIKKTNNLKDVLELFEKHKVNGVPVVDSKKKVIGMVSHADIIKLFDIHSKIQESFSNTFPLVIGLLRGKQHFEDLEEGIKKILTVPVSEFMTKEIHSVNYTEDLYDCIKKMSKYNVNRLPVLKNKKLVGIIARADIIDSIEKDLK